MQKRFLILIILIVFVAIGGGGYWFYANNKHTKQSNYTVNTQGQPSYAAQITKNTQTTSPETVVTDKQPTWPVQLTSEQADSYTVIVNKKHQLPQNYIASDMVNVLGGQMRKKTADALLQMVSVASSEGLKISVISTYRSFYTQASTYNSYVDSEGSTQAADLISAHPGFSEHQTGLAVDVGTYSGACALGSCFGDTAEGQWVAKHSYLYGFVVRYPKDKEQITGYHYEPWHLRYLGPAAAEAVYYSGKTVDEYFNVTAGDYQ